jgi:hypothetical protein
MKSFTPKGLFPLRFMTYGVSLMEGFMKEAWVYLELPLPTPPPKEEKKEEKERGIIVLDLVEDDEVGTWVKY